RFLDDFKPIIVIGKGGFGSVCEALNLADKNVYAVKRIGIPKRKVQQVLKEARVMAKFDHPNIVRYFGTWIERPPSGWQVCCFFMEKSFFFLHFMHTKIIHLFPVKLCSHSLEDWLESNRKDRDFDQIKSWFIQIVEAVAYIHERNVIHRDLKPSNILFDINGQIRVCDLGIASELGKVDETQTRTCDIGTLLYQSPEQNQKFWMYSFKVAVFTLGLIYAELCVSMSRDERI
ncbi:hypothetical protein PFISCL1PPCAC_682, partial [Pristionchus fissidentatus]